jgi:hypothetical protein
MVWEMSAAAVAVASAAAAVNAMHKMISSSVLQHFKRIYNLAEQPEFLT